MANPELYPPVKGEYLDDDGTMPGNVETFADAVVGHRIVSVERGSVPAYWGETSGVKLTLDDGAVVSLADTDDCCAYTQLDEIINLLPSIDHIVTAVRPNDDYTEWHILADFGEVMKFKVGWSCGNPFYYGYGFDIRVENNK